MLAPPFCLSLRSVWADGFVADRRVIIRGESQLKDHADFYSLCLVSKFFYTIAIRFLYRRLKIPHRNSGGLVMPLHAVLTSQQQERLLRFSAGGKDRRVRRNGKGSGLHKDLSDCGEFVREFEVAQHVDNVAEDAEIGKEIFESAIENMSQLESFTWTTSNRKALCRTLRISSSLARKPRLHSLSLSDILETDVPLLHLRPLHSVTFILDSNFPSLAHRPIPSTADYDIIRRILKTSAGTLKSLALITKRGDQSHFEDESLLFGGCEGSHKSVFKESPEGAEVTRLGRLESLTLAERPFTVKRLKVFTQAINFNNLRRLKIISCPGAELLLSAITSRGGRGLGAGAGRASEEANGVFPNLRTLGIRATQSALKEFLQCFRGLQDLRYELGCEPTDWEAPGGNRRQVSSIEISRDLLETIATYHGSTLQRLTILSLEQWKVIGGSGMEILTRKCRALVKLCCCVASFSFDCQPAVTHVSSSLSTLYLHVRVLFSESQAREFVRVVLRQIPKLKMVGILAGGYRARPFVFRVCPGGVLARVFLGDVLERELRVGEFED
ncbi:hypothetical protein C7212DRAFT_174094 [Tuber magnatum]|uniref:RNI-like protein n=1 Tax=Tuber magnatum TaxID=42249 RepID=A0A317SSI8_9PEZI|nr:hypothetical protein C7212DRAFT_174094 [Tuber magnatum]